jgi:hypothetical protein
MGSISLKYKSKSGNLTAPGDVDPGAMIPLATVTVGSGGQSTVSFTSIPQGYEHLQIRGIARQSGGTMPPAYININSQSGSNYAWHNIYGSGSSAATQSNYTTGTMPVIQGIPGSLALANTFGSFVVDVLDYANTNKYKTFRCISGADLNSGGEMHFTSGLWMNTNAITQLDFTVQSSPIAQYSSFALYGIKRAGA